MVKKLLILLLSIFALTLVGCEKNHANIDKIKIGAIAELTGDMSAVGASAKNAAEMAVQEVNERGGVVFANKKILVELIVEDDASNPHQSAIAAKKLIKKHEVLALVGPNGRANAMAAAEVAEDHKTVLIAPWVTASAMEGDETDSTYVFIFSTGFSGRLEGRILANFARYTRNYKTAAIIYNEHAATTKNQALAFEKNFTKLGGKVVAIKTYKNHEKDFLTQLTEIKALDPEMLFFPDYSHQVALMAEQARDLGIKADFVGSDNWHSTDLVSPAKDALEGAYFSTHYAPDDRSEVTQKFIEKYQQLYGVVPDEIAALTYDAYQVLFKAIAAIKPGVLTSEAVRDSLWELPVAEGVTGAIDFTKESGGEAQKSAVILQVQDGKLVWVSHANP